MNRQENRIAVAAEIEGLIGKFMKGWTVSGNFFGK